MSLQPRNNNPYNKPTTTTSGAVGNKRKYGEIDDSDFVHDEIKELGRHIKAQMDKCQIRDESSLLENLRQFGPSEESKAQLRKELEGARQALETGIYVVYRNVAPPRTNPRTGKPYMSSQNEECARLGPSHKCFCNHSLADHHSAASSPSSSSSRALVSKSGGRNTKLPPCALCSCTGFTYIPNQPEEVGDGFLSRRRGFDAAAWSAKCKCGHGSRSHDPVTRNCRECRACYGFESQFACGVCDGRWEDHVTIMETESDRRGQKLSVGNDFIPLAGVDSEFREIVFGAETAKLLPPPSSAMMGRKMIQQNPAASVSGGPMSRAQKEHMMMHQQQQSVSKNNRVEEVNDDGNDDDVYYATSNNNNNQNQQTGPITYGRRQVQTSNTNVSFSSLNNMMSAPAPAPQQLQQQSQDNPQQITCPGCSQINRRLAKFCRACGIKIQ